MNYSATILKNKYGFENPYKPDPLATKALRFLKGGKNIFQKRKEETRAND